ncbi:MAG: ABC transporter substrate-binding protein [Herminiimonas sp.]|nr:ABC transporter substrate-binding protein [Herminiimonas sp.]
MTGIAGSAGGGAVKFVKDYVAAGLHKTIPLYGPGFLTDGTLEAQGAAAQGIVTTMNYADNLNTPRDNAFRLAFANMYKTNADVYAVQGYDAAQLLAAGLKAAGGGLNNRDRVIAGMAGAQIDSPRGRCTLSRSHNPVQDIYVRQVKGNLNEVKGIAIKALADPVTGCMM